MSNDAAAKDALRARLGRARAAFLFIDMQNDFGSPKGKMAQFGFEIGAVSDCVAPARRLLDAARAGGYLVIHTAVINELGQNSAAWTSFWGEPSVTLAGSWGAAHVDELAPRADEPVIVKYAYDAFVGTNLDTMLRSRGIDTVVMAGADLNVCVADTLHHAFALGYGVVGVADCLSCFSKRDRRHAEQMKEAGLYLIENHYGIVSRSAEIIEIISGKAAEYRGEE
jgi:nicotinamidase-related amidase